jgi:hypothetical protein
VIGGAYDGLLDQLVESFDGLLDEVLLYDRALAPAELVHLAAGATPTRR